MKNGVVEYFTVHKQIMRIDNIAASVTESFEFVVNLLHFFSVGII